MWRLTGSTLVHVAGRFMLLAALCQPALPSDDRGGGDAALHRALSLHDQGRAAEALPLYAAALAAQPTRGVPVLAPQAAALEELGRMDEAQIAAASIPASDHWQLEVAFALGWQRRGRVEEAIAAYRRAALAVPAARQVQLNLGIALRTQGRLDEAIGSLENAVRLSEGGAAAEAHFHLGVSLKRLGRAAEAAVAFRSCVTAAPDQEHAEKARHLLAALDATKAGSRTGSAVPSQASEGYVRGVFDAAAADYDEHLEGKLQYRGPELLRRAVGSVLKAGARQNRSRELGLVLDLGCGTGLCGSWLRPLARRLVGVDLSRNMVAQAEAKDLYDVLIVGEIMAELRTMATESNSMLASDAAASLIVAADVFVYLGSLLPVLNAAGAVLQPGGLLAFTTEDCAAATPSSSNGTAAAAGGAERRRRFPCTRLDERSGVPVPSFCGAPDEEAEQRSRCARDGLVLQSSGRFAHSREHVLAAANQAGLRAVLEQEVSAREEGGRAVPGRLYVLARP
jgi:predicted TPR repeat methyltransferase